jgi:hypothetical protein
VARRAGQLIEARLKADTTSIRRCAGSTTKLTSVTGNIAAVRATMDCCQHPALLLVDTIPASRLGRLPA